MSEKLYVFCDDYFYLGRLDHTAAENYWDGGSKENIALCMLRIASWAVGFFSMGILYLASKYVKESNDVSLSADSENYLKWMKIIQLPISITTKQDTEELRQAAMKKDHHRKLPQFIKLFNKISAPLNPEIKKIYITSDTKVFQMDSGSFKGQCNNDFDYKDNKMSLKEGKAVLLRCATANNGYDDMRNFEYSTQVKGFKAGGNEVYSMTLEERCLWVDRRGMLPPSFIKMLTK